MARIVYDDITGEILAEGISSWRTGEQDEAYRTKKAKQKAWEEAQTRHTVAGTMFTFMFIGEAEKEQYTLANLTRLGALVVLGTHIERDSKKQQVSKLPYKSAAELEKVLGCSRRQAQYIWADLENMGAVYEEEGSMYINTDLMYRGSTKRNDTVKVFHKSIKLMLESGLKLSDIGLLFLTAPYIDLKSNYLCRNAYNTDFEEPELLGLRELAALIKVDSKTLMSKFKKMYINHKGKELPLYLKVSNPRNNKDAFIMNPLVINRGMSDSAIMELFELLA